MKLECILIRKGGTRVALDKTNYHFTPGRDKDGHDLPGAHVCEVRDQAHVARFLSIPEAYRIYDPEGKLVDTKPTEAPEPKAPEAPAGSAPSASGQNDSAPVPIADQGGNAAPAGAPTAEPDAYDKMTVEELRKLVFERTKKQPHPNAKPETLAKLLRSLDDMAKKDSAPAAAA